MGATASQTMPRYLMACSSSRFSNAPICCCQHGSARGQQRQGEEHRCKQHPRHSARPSQRSIMTRPSQRIQQPAARPPSAARQEQPLSPRSSSTFDLFSTKWLPQPRFSDVVLVQLPLECPSQLFAARLALGFRMPQHPIKVSGLVMRVELAVHHVYQNYASAATHSMQHVVLRGDALQHHRTFRDRTVIFWTHRTFRGRYSEEGRRFAEPNSVEAGTARRHLPPLGWWPPRAPPQS
jgi:hypothetical protein